MVFGVTGFEITFFPFFFLVQLRYFYFNCDLTHIHNATTVWKRLQLKKQQKINMQTQLTISFQ